MNGPYYNIFGAIFILCMIIITFALMHMAWGVF